MNQLTSSEPSFTTLYSACSKFPDFQLLGRFLLLAFMAAHYGLFFALTIIIPYNGRFEIELKKISKMAKQIDKIIVTNRKARHDYEIINSMETGIVLKGTEVKSVRDGKVNITDTYARFRKGELWLIGLRISAYSNATVENHDPLRDRKLLVHKTELRKLFRQVEEKGVTLIPLKIYLNRHLVKVELGIARGKKQYDKRAAIAEREQKRELDRQKKINY